MVMFFWARIWVAVLTAAVADGCVAQTQARVKSQGGKSAASAPCVEQAPNGSPEFLS